jgi:hypothetical protein
MVIEAVGVRTRRGPIIRLALIAATLAVLALVWAARAWAVSPPVNAGTPLSNQPPSVAVDAAGNATVAWANTAGATPFVQYCVIAPGGKACSHSGNLALADGALGLDGVNVLADGGTTVILADVYGTQGSNAGDYQPEQEWQSTDGGATFSIVDGGLSVASANINADTGPLNAIIVPGTGVLGFGWDTPGSPPTFSAFPLSAPPECSKSHPCPFARLQSATEQQLGNTGGHFASQAGAHPGVLGVFPTQFSNGPLGCPLDGLLFAYGAGNQQAGNDYRTAPGSPGSAWTGTVGLGQCGVKQFTSGGGPSGFGALETDETHGRTVYQPFNQTTKTFGSMVSVANQGELYPALSQDGAGSVYATYMYGGSGGPVALSYSSDAGKTWTGPVQLDAYDGEANVTSAVNGAGQGWVAWNNNGSVFAQPFTAADAATAPVINGGGSTNGTTVTVTVTCKAFPCTVTITILGPLKVAADVARKHKKARPSVLAKGRFTIRKAGPQRLTIRLKGAGKRFFKSRHGTVKVKGTFADAFKGRTLSVTKTIKVKITKPKHHGR